MLTIRLIGRFQVARSDGTEVTLRGRKDCGLLALLALAPRKSRTRAWLQDRLWSDRGAEQAAGSLRQSLSKIRRAFGADNKALLGDRTVIRLNPHAITVDVDDLPRALSELPGIAGTPELLEGIDVRDPEFEDWLRLTRQGFARELVALSLEPRHLDAPDRARTADERAAADFLVRLMAYGIAEMASAHVQPAESGTEASGRAR